MTKIDLWETVAPWWQESFTDGVDPEYTDQILPLIEENLSIRNADAAHVLDVGTGEGQVARFVARTTGAAVVGVDSAWAQLEVALQRTGGPHEGNGAAHDRVVYARSRAGALPFRNETFDAAIACLVFEHIEEVDSALAEIGRVLRPNGEFLFFLNHPLLQSPGSGWIDDHILEEQYWRIGPYLDEDCTMEEVAKGVRIPFIHRPLSRYINAMARSGLLVTHMEEPAPPPAFLAKADEYRQAESIPRLVFLRATKLSPGRQAIRQGTGHD